MHADIRALFTTDRTELKRICDYYFDGTGKSMRPQLVCAMARALNTTTDCSSYLLASQRQVALIAEAIHVASLMHDDVIDGAALRRGKPSVNAHWSCPEAVAAGDYVLAQASRALARLGHSNVVATLSLVLDDLVKGELMQLSSASDSNTNLFEQYTTKTYRKTASLVANACKAVAQLQPRADHHLVTAAYECGRSVGMAFQLVDDVLDFTRADAELGKPGAGADLRLGLATAPVFFACKQYPELSGMMARRFSDEADARRAFELVLKSDGVQETREWAREYVESAEAVLEASLRPGPDSDYLKVLIKSVINRQK